MIKRKREKEKRYTRREDRAIFDRVVLHITKTYLYDVGGNGLHRLPRVKGEVRLLPRCDGHDHGFTYGA